MVRFTLTPGGRLKHLEVVLGNGLKGVQGYYENKVLYYINLQCRIFYENLTQHFQTGNQYLSPPLTCFSGTESRTSQKNYFLENRYLKFVSRAC